MEKELHDNDKNVDEEKYLLDIYHKMLYPPPIGKYNKDFNFNSSLTISNLSPVLYKNKTILLGDGSFSKVHLYEHKKTKIKYAVKKMNLIQLEKLSYNKKLIHNEVNIHGRIIHPNIIRLYNFYKYKNNFYLILEYASKGTLFDIIRNKIGLTESNAFYYFIQTLNAIYFLHLHSIVHRDLKPENLLINEDNILKLCDFGWSVKLNRNKRTTFCGTVEYMAPEIIKKQKYDETIDIWSLGVLLFELVHSYSPFYSEDLDIKKIGSNIIKNKLIFKEGLSDEYKDLVKKILIKDSEKRIKIEEIYQHSFMTKYINIIYREINSCSNSLNIINEKDNKDIINNLENRNIIKDINNENNNNTCKNNKTICEIIYKKKEKLKNKGCFYKKVKNTIKKNIEENTDIKLKSKKLSNYNQKGNDTETDKIKRDTNFIFASIPTEPQPKLIPDSKYHKEIKKINTNLSSNYNNNCKLFNNKEGHIRIISNTSRNKKNIMGIRKDNNIKTLFKNQNKISHVKSFSLGQKDLNISELNDNNKLKIIISINNTQNKNYIAKKKNRKIENLINKHKQSISNYLEDNYILYPSNLKIYNKNSPFQQTMNYNNIKNNSCKNKKSINQTYLFEHKNLLNFYSNSNNNIIKLNQIDNNENTTHYNIKRNNNRNNIKNISYSKKNYINRDNNDSCQYISMINSNNTNNFSNIIINNNNNNYTPKNIMKDKNVFKLKKIIKNSNSSNDHTKYLRRINSDSYKKYFINNNKKSSKSKEIVKKIKNVNHIKKMSKFNENIRLNNINFYKDSLTSINNKINDNNVKNDLNKTININNTSKSKIGNNNILTYLTHNFDINCTNRNDINNINNNERNSHNTKININKIISKHKKIIKLSNSNKAIINTIVEDNK